MRLSAQVHRVGIPYALELLRGLDSNNERLNLKNQGLGKNIEIGMGILKAIQPPVKELDLQENGLGSLNLPSFISFIQALPGHITLIDLSKNGLGRYSPDGVVEIFTSIPRHVIFVDVMYSNLCDHVQNGGLKRAFGALHNNLKAINFCENGLEEFSSDIQMDLIVALPRSVETIGFNDRVVNVSKFLAEKLLEKVRPILNQSIQKCLADLDALTLPFIIDEFRLNQLISGLERINTPEAFLLCGILYESRVPTYCELRTGEVLENYTEMREQMALIAYLKARRVESSIRQIAEFLLWEKKTLDASPLIQARMKNIEVRPPTEYCQMTATIEQALKFYEDGNHAGAKIILETLIQENDIAAHDLVRAYEALGKICNAHGAFDEAINCYMKAIEIDPETISPYHNLGLAYLNKFDHTKHHQWFELGEINLRIALSRALTNPYYLHSLASWYEKKAVMLGLTEEALRYYERARTHYEAAKSNIRGDEALLGIVNDNLTECIAQYGHCFYQQTQYDEARAQYQAALLLNPSHVSAMNQLGMCAVKKEDYVTAQRIFAQLHEISESEEDKADAQLNLAFALRHLALLPDVGEDAQVRKALLMRSFLNSPQLTALVQAHAVEDAASHSSTL